MGESWQYAPRVVLPRRIKADLVDGAIAAVIFIVPVLVGQAVPGVVPDAGRRLFALGIPAAIVYSLFRDAAAGGTSLGKRALGLRVIALEDGRLDRLFRTQVVEEAAARVGRRASA
jgi:hypothetical protein